MQENILVPLSLILVLGVLAQWIAARLRLPAILILLVSGLLAGPVLGWIQPDKIFGSLLFPLVSLAVAVVLFEGGLSLHLHEFHPVGHVIRNLVTAGALVTWIVLAAAGVFVLQLKFAIAALLAAILIVTGPTVIGPLLREVRPTARVYNILKWEGIMIDPIGALAAVLVYQVIASNTLALAPGIILLGVFKTVLFGALCGLAGAALIAAVIRLHLAPDFLQNSLAMMAVIGAFTLANQIQAESGLFAVTVMGLALANQELAEVGPIVEFKETLRVLIVSGLFIVLAARFKLQDLATLGWRDFAFVAAAILVARPLSVLISSIRSGLSWREKAFLAWMAPRGIVAASVSAVFAIRLADLGEQQAGRLSADVFLLILVTVALYGLTSLPIARLLGVAQARPEGTLIVGAQRWARALARAIQSQGLRVILLDTNAANVHAAQRAGLEAHQVSAVSDEAISRLDLEGIGRLLALTSNDEINSLACLHFADVFGRSGVYQLAGTSADGTVASRLRGRVLFGLDVNYPYIRSRFEDGMDIQPVEIQETTSEGGLAGRYGEQIVKMALVDPSGRLSIYTAENPPAIQPGSKLIALIQAGTAENGGETQIRQNSDNLQAF